LEQGENVGKRLLIFGGSGFVGGTVAKLAASRFDIAIAGNTPKAGFEEFTFLKADITDARQVAEAFESFRPEIVINAAAMSNIDKAENAKDLTHQINVNGAANLARASVACGAKYIFISSDAVFNGEGREYTEESLTAPVNYYGQTKAMAERAVLVENPGAVVVRVSLVLGFPVNGGNSFLATVRENLAKGAAVPCVAEEVRTPVDVLTLSESLLELAESKHSGILHVCSTGHINRYELTRRAARMMGFDETLVQLKAAGPLAPGKAPRHKHGILSCAKAQAQLKTPMLNIEQTLQRALESENFFNKEKRPMKATELKPVIKMELEVAYGTIFGLEEATAVLETIKDKAPSCGKRVKQFEDDFAKYCGTKYAVAVTSATTGLTLTGIAAGLQPGDEVITTPISWIATASAFSALGAKIVFCDVDPETLNLDPSKLEALITPKTKMIVPVHLYGQCAKMDKIMDIARKHDLVVVEDCAHNPGGEYQGKKSGALGHMGVFSFHQQKNMSTLGEGGMVTTNSKELFERVLSYRSLCCRAYGPSHKYLSIDEDKHPMGKKYWELHFDDIGHNFRMTDAQAACGIEQLKKLDKHNAKRIELGKKLTEKLSDIQGVIPPKVDPEGKHVFHLYMIQLTKDFPMSKEDFMWKLYTEKGIKAWSHYLPIHLTGPYRKEGHHEGECPVAESAFERYVTLPIHPRLTGEALDYMAKTIAELAK